MIQVLNFLSERARGFILTVTSTGIGTLPDALHAKEEIASTLAPIQVVVYTLSAIVAVLTIISYGYKFYTFCKNNFRKKDLN